MSPRAHEKGIEVAWTCAADLPPVVADEGRLRQVLLNFAGNAVKFTETGGVLLSAESRRRGPRAPGCPRHRSGRAQGRAQADLPALRPRRPLARGGPGRRGPGSGHRHPAEQRHGRQGRGRRGARRRSRVLAGGRLRRRRRGGGRPAPGRPHRRGRLAQRRGPRLRPPADRGAGRPGGGRRRHRRPAQDRARGRGAADRQSAGQRPSRPEGPGRDGPASSCCGRTSGRASRAAAPPGSPAI
jgi:hypothetical protein